MSLASIVTRYARETPWRLAVSDGNVTFSFQEVEDLATRLASRLLAAGVAAGERVVVLCHKTASVVPAAIGVWKAGAVYMPVDPELPEARFRALMDRAKPRLAISLDGCAPEFEVGVPTLSLSAQEIRLLPHAAAVPDTTNHDEVGIIVSTSGSTGTPRGVQLSHASTLAYFDGHAEVFGIDAAARCMNTASYHYDVSIQDTFMPLSRGAFVFITRRLFHPDVVLSELSGYQITHLTAVATVLALLTGDFDNLRRHELSSLRTLSTGAEVCDPKLMHAWMKAIPGLRMFNGYGPSEVNSVSVTYEIPGVDEGRAQYYPIGKPHRTVRAKLIDQQARSIVRAGVLGELVLGGPQLMLGYLCDPEATASAFITLDSERYYRTGDMCALDEQGNFVFHGRRDFEVKIAGRRIDLLEIASVLNAQAGMSDALVSAVRLDGELCILAFCHEANSLTDSEASALFLELERRLPRYMLPRYLGLFHTPPRTSSGKIDRRRLEQLLLARIGIDREAGRVYRLNAQGSEFQALAVRPMRPNAAEGVRPGEEGAA